MLEFLILFKDQILLFLNYMLPIATISFMSLGLVFAIGRLLELVYTDHSKNILAFLFILSLSFAQQRTIFINFEVIYSTIELTAISVIFYILVCWKLYSRVDSILDKWFGKDKFKPTIKRKKK